MERIKYLVDLCNERKALFNSFNLFGHYSIDDKYQEITQKINRLARQLDVYAITETFSNISVAFDSLKALKKITGEEPLSTVYNEKLDSNKYSASFFDGAITLHCFEGIKEEHKKAQAI